MKRFFTQTLMSAMMLFCYFGISAQGSDCASAVVVAISGCSTTGTGDGPTDGTAEGSCFAVGGDGFADWYMITSPAADVDMTVTSGVDPDEPDTRLSIQDACGGACVAGDDDAGPGFTSSATFVAECNTDLWIQWDDRWSEDDYDWEITIDACATPDCSGLTIDAGIDNEDGTADHIITIPAEMAGGAIPCGAVLRLFVDGVDEGIVTAGGTATITVSTFCSTVDITLVNECDPFGDGCVPASVASVACPLPTFCPCSAPTVTAVDASTCAPVVDIEVTITPDAMSPDADDYDIEVGAVGFAPGTGAELDAQSNVMAAASPQSGFIGLTCGTPLEVYVQHNCTGGGESAWIGPIAVTPAACAGCACATTIVPGTCAAPTVVTVPAFDGAGGDDATCFTATADAAWYTFNAPSTGNICITSGIDLAEPDTRLSVHSGMCGALTCEVADDDGGPGFTSTAILAATAGTDYTVEWDDRWSDGGHDFEIKYLEQVDVTAMATTGGTPVPTMACANTADPDDDVTLEIAAAVCGPGTVPIIFVDNTTDGTYEQIVNGTSTTISAGAVGDVMTICVECQCLCDALVLLPPDPTICHTITFVDPATACATLPSELMDFTGRTMPAYNALTWSTASEVNTDKFVVQKSDDGLSWKDIADVSANGNSASKQDYEYNDLDVSSSAYYRLNIIDFDGYQEYSEVITLRRVSATDHGLTVYPNPTTNKINVDWQTNKAESLEMSVIDVTGKRVMLNTVESVEGVNIFEIDLTNLNSGIYFIEVNSGLESVIKRIVKQ